MYDVANVPTCRATCLLKYVLHVSDEIRNFSFALIVNMLTENKSIKNTNYLVIFSVLCLYKIRQKITNVIMLPLQSSMT